MIRLTAIIGSIALLSAAEPTVALRPLLEPAEGAAR
jgi:hypothetical protein